MSGAPITFREWLTRANAQGVVPHLSRKDLARGFAQLGFTRGAEIGVRQGAFSLFLCETIPHLELACVDVWSNYTRGMPRYSQDRNYAIARERLAPYRKARLLQMFSVDAARLFAPASLDFVYIDGNHDYPYVRDDLSAWRTRVRSGGVVAGDDWSAPGVQRAVREACGVQLYLTDDRPRRKNLKGEPFVSWFWVHP